MESNEKVKLIEKLAEFSEKLRKLDDDIEKVIGNTPICVGGSMQVVDDMFVFSCESVAQLTGIKSSSINWFIWENDCGIKALECENVRGSFIINSVESFVAFEEMEY